MFIVATLDNLTDGVVVGVCDDCEQGTDKTAGATLHETE